MTTVIELLNQLRTRDIKIWVEEGQLRINAPKGAFDSALKAELSQHKTEIIAYLNEANTTERVDTLALVPVDRTAPLPLSFTQQRLWFLDQLEPDTTTYNIPVATRLKGSLNVAALEKSLQRVVERHEVLRTTFTQENGRPVQQIQAFVPTTLTLIDLSHLPSAARLEEAKKLIEVDANQPFDLQKGPLLRYKLFRLDETDHIFLFIQHHIITDRWSMGLMWQELTIFYNEIVAGTPVSLAPLSIQYGDYAAWQQKWLESDSFQSQLDYWLKQLSGTLPVLELPLDNPRPAVATHHGGTQIHLLSADLVHAMRQLGQTQGATLFMVVLAAFEALLYRYTGQEDILIGTSIANRSQAETNALIGFFVNTLLLRTDLSGAPSFQELLDRVKQVSLEAFAYQEMPVEKLIELLHPDRDNGRAALFDVLFIFQNTPDVEGGLVNVETRQFPLEFERAMFDLTLYAVEQPDGLLFTFEYNADLFEQATIARLFAHFERLVQAIVATPTEPITQLPLLLASEMDVLDRWRRTESMTLPAGCVHHWFEAQARAVPDKTAVIYDDQSLTYAQLNAQANQLAHYLIAQGVQPETIVGLHLPRSIEMIVALLAILKAGGAYLPLDPTYPVVRLQHMVDDAHPVIIMTIDELSVAIDPDTTQVVQMAGEQQFANYPEQNPQTAVSHKNLAYIIYTSGSTGKPKGVQIEHGAMANFVQGATTSYPITGQDRVLQFATIAFDTAVEEIYPCLTQGGTLVLRTETMIDTMSTFLDKCGQWDITVLDLPTAFWHHLTASLVAEKLSLPPNVKLVIIGGEKANEQALNQWQQCVAADVRLLNTYGPTEATVVATLFEAKAETATATVSKGVLIGRPLPNYDVYVLDAALQPVPKGVAGELLIGGLSLARGYLHRPDLTEEKFVQNPFGNGRLYRTGDLVCFLPDGNLEFRGRTDDQVKIRGYRIELGEIEAVLTQHPLVRQAVVVASAPGESDRQLAAYLIADEPIAIEALHQHVQTLLPAYMVPASFTFLEQLPLMPNGKVDRRALPDPDRSLMTTADTYVAPRTPVEMTLATIWEEVLKVERVGIHDDFFILGGHSLLATQIISRIRQAFPVELPLRVLFDKPTITGLAEFLVDEQESTQASIPIEPVDRDKKLQLSFAQKRFWTLDQMEQGHGTYNIPQAVRLRGRLNVTILEDSLTLLIERHEILRTTYTAEVGVPYQVIHDAKPIQLAQVDLSQLPDKEQEAERLVREEASTSFDLSQDWPIRTKLICMGVDDYIFLTTMHHIASDGWSFTVFGQELSLIYESLEKGEVPPLLPLPVQYVDFAAWQEKTLHGEETAVQLAYWKEQLSGNPTQLDMPADFKRPAVRTFQGERVDQWLPADLASALYQFCHKESATLFMVLLATFKLVLHRYSGQDDILVGSPFAGRKRPELEEMIGLFLNTLVLRTDLSGEPTYRELVRRVREVCLSAFTNQEIPFELILEELHVERDLSRTLLFQVFFNVLNFGASKRGFGSLTLEPIINPDLDSKFDLTLYVGEKQGSVGLFLVYNTDLFTEARMTEFLAQFISLLQQVISTPDQPIGSYSLMTDWAESVLPDPTTPLDKTWHGSASDALSRHAAIRPQQTAVIDTIDSWSYQELNQRSNQLAHYLIEQGVQPQDVIAIYGHRSASLVWALMGIFKAGAAFLILDPSYPEGRLVNYLELAQPKAFLQVGAAGEPPPILLETLTVIHCPISLTLPSLTAVHQTALLANYPITDPPVCVGPDDLGCLAFTSGSTGLPKGIRGRHGSLTHFLPWIAKEFGLNDTDRFSMLSGLAHDPLQRDIFTALWVGGTLCIPDPEQMMTPGWAANWLHEQGVTFANLTPAMSQVITTLGSTEAKAAPSIPTLRYAFFIGERLTRQDVNNLRELCPGVTAVNLYGATETQRALSYYVVPTDLPDGEPIAKDVLPLGKAMPGAQLLLLNPAGQLAGVGEMAEICFRSPHLALGYLHDEVQTASRFRLNPFGATDEHDRLYFSGDMGRYLPDGNVEFVNRADDQIKIRGFRVELGEIDAMLEQHTAVHQTITIASKNSQESSTRLSAFVVLKPGQAVSATDLRHYLGQKVPQYMIPADILLLDAMPMTPNGKIDRRALVVPDHAAHDANEGFTEPRNQTEAILVQIWERVLGIHPISTHDNFFEIGGHSLTAVRVFAQIERETGLKLPLTILFQAPTIAQLADAIENKGWVTNWTSLVPVQIHGSRPPFFYVSPFLISVLSLSMLGQHLGLDQPLYGLQPQGMDGDHPIHRSVKEMASHYINEIKTLKPDGPYIIGGHCAGSWVAFEMAQQLQAQGEVVDLLILMDSRPPNIEPPPVNRLRYVVNRLNLYRQDGRLGDAISWQLSLAYQRFITFNFGKENAQRVASVRKAHAEAHQVYRSGIFDGDAIFIRSAESANLRDQDWHYRWSELITGELIREIIPGTHAGLLMEPNVNVMAAKIRTAIDKIISTSKQGQLTDEPM